MTLASTVDELFEQEYSRLVRALSVAGDVENAADAVQDAFVNASRRWSHVGRLDDPAGWVRRVAVNKLRNGHRNRRRRDEILAGIRAPEPAQLDALDLDLLAAVRALPQRQRLAVCLHHLAGYPIGEVAHALEVAEGTVKSNLHDARASLRRALEVSDDAR